MSIGCLGCSTISLRSQGAAASSLDDVAAQATTRRAPKRPLSSSMTQKLNREYVVSDVGTR